MAGCTCNTPDNAELFSRSCFAVTKLSLVFDLRNEWQAVLLTSVAWVGIESHPDSEEWAVLSFRVCFSKCFLVGFFFLVWKTVVLQKHYEHKDSFPLLQTGKTEFRYSLCNESGGRTINWSRKSWSGLIFLLFPLSNNEFLLKEGSSHLRSVRFYACLLFYTSNRVMYAFLVTPAEAWKGSTFHFHYISFISLFWRKGSIKYKIDITKISFYCGWKVLVVNVTPHKAAELQVTIKDLEKMSAW